MASCLVTVSNVYERWSMGMHIFKAPIEVPVVKFLYFRNYKNMATWRNNIKYHQHVVRGFSVNELSVKFKFRDI